VSGCYKHGDKLSGFSATELVGQGRIKGFVGRRHFPLLGPFGDSKSTIRSSVLSIIRDNEGERDARII
jgi:hypothetical protein